MTVKMMGVIYRAYKNGKLVDVSADDIDTAYRLVKKLNSEIGGWELKAYHRDAYDAAMWLRDAVTAIFNGDYVEANTIVRCMHNVNF